MNFGVMQTELADRLGVYSETKTNDATKIRRWLNMGQQYISGKMNWPFMLSYEVIQTVTDITTGTVAINAAATALTFSSAPTPSVAGRYIKIQGSNNWYRISAHTAAATAATLATAFVGSSNVTGQTYTVRNLLYATNSTTPLDSILDIKKTVNPTKLISLNQAYGDFFLPLYLDAGEPISYIMGPVNSSGNLQFSLANPPDTVLNLLCRGILKLVDMSASSDTTIIPQRWHDAVVDMGAHYGFTGIKDEQARNAFQLASVKIADMARVYNTDLGRHRVMAPFDAEVNYGPIFVLPSNYGKMY